MVYTFARVNAVLAMKVKDYFVQGRRGWVRLHEKGGKEHEVPCHHKLEHYLDEYIAAAGIAPDSGFQPPGVRDGLHQSMCAREDRRRLRGEDTMAPPAVAKSCQLRIALRLQRETADRPHRDRKAWSLHPAAYK